MKVFLSWSGRKSQAVAGALRDWLPEVLQIIQPWLSGEDIPLGARWASEIARILEEADSGIICLTSDNIQSQWLNFEAGALSKQSKTPLCVYALDLNPAEMRGPLAQFQSVKADKDGTFRLIRSINSLSHDFQIPLDRLERVFNLHWPLLDERLKSIARVSRSEREGDLLILNDKIDQALALLHSISGTSPAPERLRHGNVTSRDGSPGRPRIFIGSSAEGLAVAEAVKRGLDSVVDCTIWAQGVFKQPAVAIGSIVDVAVDFDYAIVVLTADELVLKRGRESLGPRDNIVFELGLFTGALGRARTFMVIDREDPPVLPADLAGVTVAMYSSGLGDDLVAALGPVCTQIKRAMGILLPGF